MKSHRRIQLPAQPGVYRLQAAGAADPGPADPRASGPYAPSSSGPVDLLVELGPEAGSSGAPVRTATILARGRPAEIDAHPAAHAAIAVDLTSAVVMPGMVNAHTHLDLTHLGPLAHDPNQGFVSWVDRVREGRAQSPEAIAASVRRGIELSLRAGVTLVGDIAGAAAGVPRLEPCHALAASPLSGVSFLEFFAIGAREAAALDRVEAVLSQAARDGLVAARTPPRGTPGTSLGLQPHAPNTVSLPAYGRAVEIARRHNLPLATHLAETPEEREFIAHATGPQRDMLERFGIWTDDILEHIGKGLSPIEHLAAVLAESPFIAAHCNDVSEPARAFETLAATHTSVAYCPRASTYFNAAAHFGPHRYRDMLAAGINVCLGTDSILNLPRATDAADGPGMSILDEARLLYERDNTDPRTLLQMMTVNGCRALRWDDAACSLAPGATPLGLVAVDISGTPEGQPAAERILRSRAHAQLLTVAPAPAASR
ncbi:MAG: amidohydrolase family protein [Phycisphaerales bacterium JB041]